MQFISEYGFERGRERVNGEKIRKGTEREREGGRERERENMSISEMCRPYPLFRGGLWVACFCCFYFPSTQDENSVKTYRALRHCFRMDLGDSSQLLKLGRRELVPGFSVPT